MDAGGGAERVAAHERIADRDIPFHGAGDGLAVFEQLRQILAVELPEELQVEEQELHLRVADALADPESRGMHAIGAVLEGPDGVLEREAAIVVTVPVDADVGAGAGDHVLRELNEIAHAVGSGVADGVREAEPRRAVIDGGPEQRGEHLGTRARRVLGDVGDGEAGLHRDVDGLGAALRDELDVPALHELADGGGADEGIDLDGQARALRELDHRRDVRDDGPSGTGHADLHLAVDDLLAEAQRVLEGALAGARETDVGDVDTELLHEVEDLQLVFDPGIDDGRILEPIAEGLVEERGVLRQNPPFAIDLVPVEDEVGRAIALGGELGHDNSMPRPRAVSARQERRDG